MVQKNSQSSNRGIYRAHNSIWSEYRAHNLAVLGSNPSVPTMSLIGSEGFGAPLLKVKASCNSSLELTGMTWCTDVMPKSNDKHPREASLAWSIMLPLGGNDSSSNLEPPTCSRFCGASINNRASVPQRLCLVLTYRRGYSRQTRASNSDRNCVESLFRGGDKEMIPCKGQWSSGNDAAFTWRRSEVQVLSDPLAPFLWSVKSNKTPTPHPTHPFTRGHVA